MIGMQLSGQWEQAVRDMEALAKVYDRAAQKAVGKEAHLWAKEVRQGIVTQSSASEANWRNLQPSTLRQKAPKTKMLIDTGALVRSIRAERITKWKWLIGVKRGSRGKGEKGTVNLVNIAAVHELGTTTAGRGNTVVIPARPFIKPVHDKMAKGLERRVWDNIETEVRKYVPRRALKL